MKEFDIKEESLNYHALLAKNWGALTTKGADGRVNSMTISWGQYGSLWMNGRENNLPVATVYVRTRRFTRPLMDFSAAFSISFVKPEYKKALGFLGSKSGADYPDKIAASGLTTEFYNGIPYIAESSIVLVCRKLYQARLQESGFVDQEIKTASYSDGDYHVEYVGQIVAALKE